MKGRQFGFLCMLCTAWVVTRTAIRSRALAPPSLVTARPISQIAHIPPFVARYGVDAKIASGASAYLPTDKMPGFSITRRIRLQTGRDAISAGSPLVSLGPLTKPMPVAATAASGFDLRGVFEPRRENRRRFHIYAYSFWRKGGGPLTPGLAQYGGGQSGVIATFEVAPQWSLLVRGALAHDNIRERELATGLRWTPLKDRAFALVTERRFRNGQADALAIYVAGGKSEVPLPFGFRLDAYGQAGYLTGDDNGGFFDAQARAGRDLVPLNPTTKLNAGAGVWAGGQEGVVRLDVGPSIGTNVKLASTNVHIDADWRFRIAGDASPGNGPSLTLSTSF